MRRALTRLAMFGALVAGMAGLARAQDLPAVPFGLPEETITPMIDPILSPRLLRVQSAFSDVVMTYFPERTPGGKWLLLTEAEAEARLGRILTAEDAALQAEVLPHGRHKAEWLAATLVEASAGLGPEAALARAEDAVAMERQLAANAYVFRDFFPGTDIAAVVGAATSARQAAIRWALEEADAARADGDPAWADRVEMRAFVWAQTLSQGAAARAMVRPFRADGPLVAIETMSDLMGKYRLIMRYLDAYSLSPDQLAVTDASLTAAREAIFAGIAEMQAAELDLAAAILPRPLSLPDLRARLAPDEALILVLQGEFQFTIFAVSRTDFAWHVTDANTLEIDAGVEALLGGIGAWKTRSAAPLEELRETPAEGMAAQAHWLWQQMLAPAGRVTAGKKRLLISATGMAAHFPWQLMVTSPAAPGAGYGDLAWLVRDHALVIVPAVEALTPATADNRDLSYLGFGAPDYAAGRGTWAARNTGAPVVDLLPLPEAADEVEMVGALYPADRRTVLTGAGASEAALDALSQSGALSRVDVLHFATHGLIYGDHPDVGEGLIALTARPEAPPPVTQLTVETLFAGQPDGALTESEIRGLWLTARLVILSACKTAAGQNTDRDGVEGLAAAFLHAGAKRVMASHWPVNSDAAVDIVTAMMASDPGLQDPATALRGAMLAEIAKGGRKADPSWWAPFSIIGAP